MKFIISIILFVLFVQLNAQDTADEFYPEGEPYPAPVLAEGLTQEEAAFIRH